jgi:ribosome-binding protein aMBF1 (putative translation factor)
MMSKGISPIGTAVSDRIKESHRDLKFRAEYERLAPYEALARTVIKRRGALGLTQAELAARMGAATSTVSRIERGQHAVRARTRETLAGALDITIMGGQR